MPLGSPYVAGSDPSCCKSCEQAPFQLDGLRACALHSGPLRKAIHQLKYQDLRSLAHPLGKLMAERWVELAPLGFELDVIVPVPLHSTRQRQRGYNQAALLARELAAHLHRPVVEDNLVRTRATAPQVDLNAQERRANVRGAFYCTGNDLSGKCVMLIDDVYTTGSTLDSACTALREAGTSSVWAYTLARAKSGPYEPLEQSTTRRMEDGTHSKG
jgi:ComF family protein